MTKTEGSPSISPGGLIIKVIPIALGSKRPAITGWQAAAAPLSYWRMQKDWANWDRWAAPCGPPNGFWVLDVDGVEGRESLRVLMIEHRLAGWDGPLSLCTVHTPSGMHVYFKWTPKCDWLTNTAGVIAPGLDVRT